MDPALLELLDKVYAKAHLDPRLPFEAMPDAARLRLTAAELQPAKVTFEHGAAVKRLREAARVIELEDVADRFVASFGSAAVRNRSPLVCAVFGRALPSHRYRAFSAASEHCTTCGALPLREIDVTREAWRRHRYGESPWFGGGGVVSALLDLEEAATLDKCEPTETDIEEVQRVLDVIASHPGTASPGAITKTIGKVRAASGHKHDKLPHLLEDLGRLGVLETPEHRGFHGQFVTFAALQARPNARVEVDPPIAFWRPEHGVNEATLLALFGHRGIRAGRDRGAAWVDAQTKAPARPGPAAQTPPTRKKAPARKAAKARSSSKDRAVLPGDIVYVEHDSGRFAVLYCTKLNKSGSKASPVLERVAWVGARAPSPSEVDGLPLRGGPTGARSSILVTDMKLGVRIVLLRRGAPEPDASHLRQPKTAAPYRTNMRSLLGESVLLQGS